MTPFTDSSLPKRIVVAVAGIPLLLVTAYLGSYYFFALTCALSFLASNELMNLFAQKGAKPLRYTALTGGFLILVAAIFERLQVDLFGWLHPLGIRLSVFSQFQFLTVVIVLFVFALLAVELFRAEGSALLNVGAGLAGGLIIPLSFASLVMLREVFPFGFPVYKFFPHAIAQAAETEQIVRWGGWTIVSVMISIWICDTAAYFVGLSFGRHKLFPRVSPAKSWEGAIAGLIGAIATMLIAKSFVLAYLTVWDALVLGSIVGIFGQMGDLAESRLKRDAGVKDSSNLLPGHGGIYDRFDSLIFISPLVYIYIDFIVLS